MSANITDLLSRVSDSNTGRPIITSLASPGKAIGAASINLAAATNWTTDSAIYFSIYETTTASGITVKDTTTQTDWKGTLSGTTVSSLTLTGGTDRAYNAGAIVEQTPTARYAKDGYDWALARHNQDGSHKAFTETNIVPTAAIQDNAVTTAKMAAGSVTNAKLSTAADDPGGAWNTFNGFVSGNGWSGTPTQSYRWKQVGKLVTCQLYITGTSNATGAIMLLPVAAAASNNTSFFAHTASSTSDNISLVNLVGAVTQISIPMGYNLTAGNFFTVWPTTGTKTIQLTFQYEAA